MDEAGSSKLFRPSSSREPAKEVERDPDCIVPGDAVVNFDWL
jgi:hypothetical protein